MKDDDPALVILQLTIDARGRVAQVEFLKQNSNEKINAVYLEAARDWLFRPARDGAGYKESKLSFQLYVHRHHR